VAVAERLGDRGSLVHRDAAVLRRVGRGGAPRLVPQLHDRGHLDAGIEQVERRLIAVLVGARDHGAPARRHAIEPHQALRPRAEHDPGQVVVAEHQRLLKCAGSDDDVLRPHLVHAVAADHRQEVVGEQAVAHGIRVNGDVRARLDPGDEAPMLLLGAGRLGAEAGIGERAAEQRKLFDQQDLEPVPGRLEGGAHPRRPAADHDQVVEAVGLVVVAVARLEVDPAEPREAADDRLPAPPRALRAMEGPVVEADGQKAAEQAQRRAAVVGERAAVVLARNVEAGRDAVAVGEHVRLVRQLHQRVGIVPGH
jgi:hypothetical protein